MEKLYTVLEDYKSATVMGKVYAYKGDRVKLISYAGTHDNMAVVENNGEKFGIRIENLRTSTQKKRPSAILKNKAERLEPVIQVRACCKHHYQ